MKGRRARLEGQCGLLHPHLPGLVRLATHVWPHPSCPTHKSLQLQKGRPLCKTLLPLVGTEKAQKSDKHPNRNGQEEETNSEKRKAPGWTPLQQPTTESTSSTHRRPGPAIEPYPRPSGPSPLKTEPSSLTLLAPRSPCSIPPEGRAQLRPHTSLLKILPPTPA